MNPGELAPLSLFIHGFWVRAPGAPPAPPTQPARVPVSDPPVRQNVGRVAAPALRTDLDLPARSLIDLARPLGLLAAGCHPAEATVPGVDGSAGVAGVAARLWRPA